MQIITQLPTYNPVIMEHLPPIFSGRAGQVITGLQLIVVASSYANEKNPETRAQYSKFSQTVDLTKKTSSSSPPATWSSKLAMFVIYFPALVASTILLVLGSSGNELLLFSAPAPSVASYCCIIHFLKRVLETLFLHKYSGRTDVGTPTMISIYYTLTATLVAYGAGMGAPLTTGLFDGTYDIRDMLGVTVFLIGIIGNFYHHFLLAKLRSGKQAKSVAAYVAPKGGLFNYVAAPHYFFELLGWAGIAVASNQLNVYLVMAGMTSYLAGRSVAQNDWNRARFKEKDWPKDRKNLVPFIF